MGPADGVLGLDGDLRAVEGAASLVHHQLEVHPLGGGPEGLGGHLPLLVAAHRLVLGTGGQLEVEVVEPEVPQERQHEGQRGVELVGHLLTGAEEVGVVLGHPPHPGQAVDHPGLLVAVDGAELEHPQGQLAVRPLAALVDEDVERAVHRLQVVLEPTVELHGRVHPVGEPVEVARRLEQLRLGDVRGVHELVAGRHVPAAGVLLHQATDGAALGVEDGQARSDLLGEREEVEFGAQLAVVALLRLLEPVEVLGQRLVGLPGGAVDPLELLALLVPPPVGTGHPHEGEVAQPAGGGDVGSPAEVGEGR